MKRATILSFALILSGCSYYNDIVKRRNDEISSHLPEGCEILDLGNYITKNGTPVPTVFLHCKEKANIQHLPGNYSIQQYKESE